MGILSEEFTGKLVKDKEIKAHLKVRSNEFIFETVDRRLLADYDPKEWIEHKPNKKSVVLKKKKSHHAMFEDRLWTILAKMGFTTLNNKGFRLPYVDDESIPGKQIDAFAADDETIIVVECKSAEVMKKQHFSKELNEYDMVIKGGSKVLRKAFSEKHKIRYIFATNNITLSTNDKNRLKELKMMHFNQDDIHYYEQLIDTVGSAGKYQLLARLFKDVEIPALENKVPAIRGEMGGYNYYSFALEPEKLLKISYILHRVNITNDDRGYQRLVKKSRLKEIETFVNDKGYFPNSIILNINTKNDEPLNFDKLSCTHDSKLTQPVILHLPRRYHSAFIIDGQHRLYGYSNSKFKSTNSIPVVAFENLAAEEQVKLFIQINSKQKAVPTNLLTTIEAELMWNSTKYDEAISAFMSKLLAVLGEKEDSPLYRCIMLGEKASTASACVTLNTIIVYGFKKSLFFAKLNKKKMVETGYFWVDPKLDDGTFDYMPMLNKSYAFFKTYFEHIKENNERVWNLGDKEGGYIATNAGIVCFTRIASDLLGFIKKYEHVDYASMPGDEIAKLTFRYLEPILESFATYDAQRISHFRKFASNGANVENGVRELQKEIHSTFKDFNPEGLQKWILDNSGKFNDIAKSATEKFETAIKDKTYLALQEKFGETWWKDGVPPEIRKSAATTKIDEDSDESEQEFLHLPDYKKIISRNWELFKPIFADPAIKSNKDEQLKWFDKLIPLRNKVAHNRKVVAEDHTFITQLNEWLPARIGIEKLNTAV